MYDWAIWIVCLLTICSCIVSKGTKASRWIQNCVLARLLLTVIGFVFINITAKQQNYIAIEVPLNGYSAVRIDEIFFRYNGKSFRRIFNLEDFSKVVDLINRKGGKR